VFFSERRLLESQTVSHRLQLVAVDTGTSTFDPRSPENMTIRILKQCRLILAIVTLLTGLSACAANPQRDAEQRVEPQPNHSASQEELLCESDDWRGLYGRLDRHLAGDAAHRHQAGEVVVVATSVLDEDEAAELELECPVDWPRHDLLLVRLSQKDDGLWQWVKRDLELAVRPDGVLLTVVDRGIPEPGYSGGQIPKPFPASYHFRAIPKDAPQVSVDYRFVPREADPLGPEPM